MLITGSHRQSALKELTEFWDYDNTDLNDRITKILESDNIGLDVTDIILAWKKDIPSMRGYP